AGCTSATSEESPADVESTTDVEPAPVADETGPNGPWVQDLWLYESVRTVTRDGAAVDLTEHIIAGLGAPSRSVSLPEDATFHVHDSLRPSVTTFGKPRTDVDVVAGTLESDGGIAL